MFYVKLFKKKHEVLVAIADKELINKTFRGNGMKIEVTSSFYEGDLLNENDMIARLKIATIANLVGKRCIEIAMKNGIVNKDNIIYIGEVPHAQVFCMSL